MAQEEKVLKLSQAEKDKLLGLFAAAGLDGGKQFLADGADWLFEPATPGELVLAEYALAH